MPVEIYDTHQFLFISLDFKGKTFLRIMKNSKMCDRYMTGGLYYMIIVKTQTGVEQRKHKMKI